MRRRIVLLLLTCFYLFYRLKILLNKYNMEFIKHVLFRINNNKQTSSQHTSKTRKISKEEHTINNEVAEIEPGNSVNSVEDTISVRETAKNKKGDKNLRKNEPKKAKSQMLLIKTYSKNKISNNNSTSIHWKKNLTKNGKIIKYKNKGRKKSLLKTNAKTTTAENVARDQSNELSEYRKYNIIVEKEDDTPIYEVPIEYNGNSPFEINNNSVLDEPVDKNKITLEFDSAFGQMDAVTDNERDDSVENLIKNINPQEWLNLDEFENIIKDLNSGNSSELFDFEDSIDKCTIDKSTGKDLFTNSDQNRPPNIQAEEKSSENDVIYISSDDEMDLKLSLSLDKLDTVSLNSAEVFCEDIDSNISDGIAKNDEIIVYGMINEETADTTLKEDNNDWKLKATEIESPTDKKYVDDTDKDTKKKGIKVQTEESTDTILKEDKDWKLEITESLTDKEYIDKDTRKKIDDVDTKSVCSNISNTDDNEDSYCSGYNSSDFEFTTEDEAKRHGFIINYFRKGGKTAERDTCETIEVATEPGDVLIDLPDSDDVLIIDLPSTSRQDNIPGSRIGTDFVVDYSYRESHEVPEGGRYMNLFEGQNYMPSAPFMYENKALPDMRYEGIGFDMRAPRQDDNDDYKKEADDSAKKILSMYPGENRRRRRF